MRDLFDACLEARRGALYAARAGAPVIRGDATIAIVRARLQKEAFTVALIAFGCALLAYLQRYDDESARFAGCLFFGTLAGVAVGMLQRGFGRFREIELCERSAPLFGRELARATALVPCVVVTTAVAAYWIVDSLYERPHAETMALTLLAANLAAVTALCATVRSGTARSAYLAVALAVAPGVFALGKTPIAFAVGVCVVATFLALRQYGEGLARYAPLFL